MLPIVDSNWSPASQYAATDCHILRAVAVQSAMPNAEVDRNLASLNQHAKTPGLGGLPNGIAAYLDIAAPDALMRIEEYTVSDRVLGVNVVLNNASVINETLIKPCVDVLVSSQASIDISGDVENVTQFLKVAEHATELHIVCNLSCCSRAGNLLSIHDWPSLIRVLAAHENVAVKITDPPAGEFRPAVDQLTQSIQQLASSIGIARIIFGSSVTDGNLPDNRHVWQYFDAATRWASALERDNLFRENAVKTYRL
ncbi:MAG: amidohydrolase family protein [Granulosicoccaceae bacterium]